MQRALAHTLRIRPFSLQTPAAAMARDYRQRRHRSGMGMAQAVRNDGGSSSHGPLLGHTPAGQTINGAPQQQQQQLSQNGNHAPPRQSPGNASGAPSFISSRQSHRERSKRKADGALPAPVNSRRQRAAAAPPAGNLLTMDRIIREFPMPTKAEYPDIPSAFFRTLNQTPTSTVHNFLAAAGLELNRHVVTRANSTHAIIAMPASINLPFVTAEADGHTKQQALAAAHLHLASKLHSTGVLKDMFVDSTGVEKVDQATLKGEADAKAEIYDYAARFTLVPDITMRTIEPNMRVKGKKRRVIEITVSLPAQNLQVSSRAYDLRQAETLASIKFKEAAEKYHAENADESMSVRDSNALHSGNARLFFDFLKVSRPNMSYEVFFKEGGLPKGLGGSSTWRAQVQSRDNHEFETWAPMAREVIMPSKKKAEDIAYLVAAVEILGAEPALMAAFQSGLSSSGNAYLAPMRALRLTFEDEAGQAMRDTLWQARQAGLADEHGELEAVTKSRNERPRHTFSSLKDDEMERKNEKLLKDQNKFNEDPNLAKLRDNKAALPMSQYREQVLELVNGNRYSIIIGATGSGKTTQVPQILLENEIGAGVGSRCNVICTQPRRIAATSVARRVADERAERLCETVGYHVRFDQKRPRPGGSITYCTTGILLQQMQHSPDDVFDNTSHIIIDEVHERDVLIDFLMIVLKSAVEARKRAGKSIPNIVLMSATIDADLFSKYFENTDNSGAPAPCPSLSVPGRTFPVKELYLDDILGQIKADGASDAWLRQATMAHRDTRDFLDNERAFRPMGAVDSEEDIDPIIDWKKERKVNADGEVLTEKEDALVPVPLVAATTAHICRQSDDGAILVFMPGYDEMKAVRDILQTQRPLGVDFNDESKYRLFMLHSSVPADEQAMVFEPVPPGCRKIILSTNIAETSVTIPDIQYVVDTGKLREKRYDQVRRITKLQCTWISKSNAKQRAGRAGRVQNGNYYALYSKSRYQSLRAIGLPEILRADLQEVCLDIKAQAFQEPIRAFLSQAIEPPSASSVDVSVKNLQALQALTETEDLTALGRVLAKLPVHPSLGKMIVLGVIFRCLDPMIILGAGLSERSLFVRPPEKRREAAAAHDKFIEGSSSDHIMFLNAYNELRASARSQGRFKMNNFAMDNFLHHGAYRTIESTARQIEEILVESGLIPYAAEADRFEGEWGHPTLNHNSSNVEMVKALALAGLYPNLAAAQTTKGSIYRCMSEKNVMIHPSSVNHVRDNKRAGRDVRGSGANTPDLGRDTLLSFTTLASSNDGNSLLMRDTTIITPLMAVLFGGRIAKSANILTMDNWLPFYVHARPDDVKLLVEFRKALDRVLVQSFQDLADLRASDARVHASNSASLGSRKNANATNMRQELAANTTRTSFADDKVRMLFSEGLSDVFRYAERGTIRDFDRVPRDVSRSSSSFARGPSGFDKSDRSFSGPGAGFWRDEQRNDSAPGPARPMRNVW